MTTNTAEMSMAAKEHDAEAKATEALSTKSRLTILCWLLQIATAAILFQTLFFKFTAAEESVYIFKTLGMEPWGRIGSGMAELVACVLLLVPRTVAVGALLSLGVIGGALISHLTKLGIVVKDDGGLLFALALIVFASSVSILVIRREQLPALVRAVVAVRAWHVLPSATD